MYKCIARGQKTDLMAPDASCTRLPAVVCSEAVQEAGVTSAGVEAER